MAEVRFNCSGKASNPLLRTVAASSILMVCPSLEKRDTKSSTSFLETVSSN